MRASDRKVLRAGVAAHLLDLVGACGVVVEEGAAQPGGAQRHGLQAHVRSAELQDELLVLELRVLDPRTWLAGPLPETCARPASSRRVLTPQDTHHFPSTRIGSPPMTASSTTPETIGGTIVCAMTRMT